MEPLSLEDASEDSASVGQRAETESKSRPRVSGLNGVPLIHLLPVEERFAHGIRDWKQVPVITVREFAMVQLMDEISDKPDWDVDILNEDVIARWRTEPMAAKDIISEKSWEWCIQELRDKAAASKRDGFVKVLDTGTCVCKADSQVVRKLTERLNTSLLPIVEERGSRRKTGAGVTSFIDPTSNLLVWGETPILQDGSSMIRDGKGSLLHNASQAMSIEQPDQRKDAEAVTARMDNEATRPWEWAFRPVDKADRHVYEWSYNYQLLPSTVDWNSDERSKVKLTSYVSDLNDDSDAVYDGLEELMERCIEQWNAVLIRGRSEPPERFWTTTGDSGLIERWQTGRVPCRIVTYGIEWENDLPEWALAFRGSRSARSKEYELLLQKFKAQKKLRPKTQPLPKPAEDAECSAWWAYDDSKREYANAQCIYQERRKDLLRFLVDFPPEDSPDPTEEQWQLAREYLGQPYSWQYTVRHMDWEHDMWRCLSLRARNVIHRRLPEPGTAYSYEEWKHDENTGKAIVDMRLRRRYVEDVAEAPSSTPHNSYTVNLQDEYREQGLQVIICVDETYLSPENPEYSGGDWDLYGNMNEHIVAASVLTLQSDNISESKMALRQHTCMSPDIYDWGKPIDYRSTRFPEFCTRTMNPSKEAPYYELEETFGFHEDCFGEWADGALPFQEVGKINLRPGRLISFPNVMEHRREPFSLLDPSRPGFHRSVTILLVDPNYRICSTRDVAPQTPSGKLEWPEVHDQETKRRAEELNEEHKMMMYAQWSLLERYTFYDG